MRSRKTSHQTVSETSVLQWAYSLPPLRPWRPLREVSSAWIRFNRNDSFGTTKDTKHTQATQEKQLLGEGGDHAPNGVVGFL